MTHQEITMWLTVANSVIMVIWGILITRKIKKQDNPGSLDELWRDFSNKPENREELRRIIEKSKRGEKITPQDYEDD